VTSRNTGHEAQLRRTLDSLWSAIARDEPVVAAGSLSSAELAFPTSAGTLRLALDRHGLRHLLVPQVDHADDVEDRQSAGVQLTTRVLVVQDRPVRYLDLACRRGDLSGVFTGLVADVCLALARDVRHPGVVLARTLNSWRELFGDRRQQWTVPRLAGLYGELLVLEKLLDRQPTSATTWEGPTGAAQDFRSHPNAIEVKTTASPAGRVVRIHGVDQLEKPPGGFLALVWCRVAVVAPGDGESVPDVVRRCLERGGDQPLSSLLDRLTLPPMSSAELLVNFHLRERRIFDVGADFPRITPDRFAGGAAPAGVGGVEYLVDLDTVSPADEELGELARRFLERR
jgi:hypothetical protein